MSEESVFIGDFEIPLEDVKVVQLPVGKEVLFEVKKSERKTYKEKVKQEGSEEKIETGRELAYYNFQLSLPDFPGETIFHKFFLRSGQLRNRHPSRGWVAFLTLLELPLLTTSPVDNGMVGIRFYGTLREDKERGEYVIANITKKA